MNRFALVALLCTQFSLTAPAQEPAVAQDWMPGAFSPAPLDSPLVLEAKKFIQNHLSSMNLTEMTEAYTQVVAGVNVRFVSTVLAEDGPSTWQFEAYQTLNGTWHFWSARRI
jgi:hypothetical protein